LLKTFQATRRVLATCTKECFEAKHIHNPSLKTWIAWQAQQQIKHYKQAPSQTDGLEKSLEQIA
jgi:hypothetical protein